ncbi:MAG TPA: hypothetical protein DEP99_01095, partial [Nitrospiraceae bacterium]|nr:hypothetical protein [Nitrospiraceae bacterium]
LEARKKFSETQRLYLEALRDLHSQQIELEKVLGGLIPSGGMMMPAEPKKEKLEKGDPHKH